MDALARMKRSRTAAKGWLSRATSRLQQAVEKKDVDLFEMRRLIADFDRRLGASAWDEAQTQVELELEEEALAADMEEAGNFWDSVVELRMRAEKLSQEEECISTSQSVRSNSHQLPKLNLPKFGGDSSKLTAFFSRIWFRRQVEQW